MAVPRDVPPDTLVGRDPRPPDERPFDVRHEALGHGRAAGRVHAHVDAGGGGRGADTGPECPRAINRVGEYDFAGRARGGHPRRHVRERTEHGVDVQRAGIGDELDAVDGARDELPDRAGQPLASGGAGPGHPIPCTRAAPHGPAIPPPRERRGRERTWRLAHVVVHERRVPRGDARPRQSQGGIGRRDDGQVGDCTRGEGCHSHAQKPPHHEQRRWRR